LFSAHPCSRRSECEVKCRRGGSNVQS
jgi:hypothetical protein